MGKRGSPSTKNLDKWVSNRDALKVMLIRLDDMKLVFAELDTIKPRRMWAELVGDPPRIHRRLLTDDDVVVPRMPNCWDQFDRRKLREGDYLITYKLNGKPGWLYLWKTDLKKYFPKTVTGVTVDPEAKKPARSGAPAKEGWPEIGDELIRRWRRNPGIIEPGGELALARSLEIWAENKFKKPPKITALRWFVKGAAMALRAVRSDLVAKVAS